MGVPAISSSPRVLPAVGRAVEGAQGALRQAGGRAASTVKEFGAPVGRGHLFLIQGGLAASGAAAASATGLLLTSVAAVSLPVLIGAVGVAAAVGVGVGWLIDRGVEKISGGSIGEIIYEWMHPEKGMPAGEPVKEPIRFEEFVEIVRRYQWLYPDMPLASVISQLAFQNGFRGEAASPAFHAEVQASLLRRAAGILNGLMGRTATARRTSSLYRLPLANSLPSTIWRLDQASMLAVDIKDIMKRDEPEPKAMQKFGKKSPLGGEITHLSKIRNRNLSVVIPTMNRHEFLAQCLRSVAQQTFDNFEIVVVNDGGLSVDEVVAPYHSKITLINNKKTLGPPSALNRGVHASRGSCIALCDDDDQWAPTHLAELMAEQSTFVQPTLVYTDVVALDQTLNRRMGVLRRDFDLAYLKETNYIVPSSILFPRAIYNQIGGFDEMLPYYWDWDFFLKAAHRFSVQRLPKLLTSYRIHGQAYSSPGTSHDSEQEATKQLERQRQLERLSMRHGLGKLTLKHLFDNFEK